MTTKVTLCSLRAGVTLYKTSTISDVGRYVCQRRDGLKSSVDHHEICQRAGKRYSTRTCLRSSDVPIDKGVYIPTGWEFDNAVCPPALHTREGSDRGGPRNAIASIPALVLGLN